VAPYPLRTDSAGPVSRSYPKVTLLEQSGSNSAVERWTPSVGHVIPYSFVYVSGLMRALLLRVRLRRRSGPSALLIAIVGLMSAARMMAASSSSESSQRFHQTPRQTYTVAACNAKMPRSRRRVTLPT
jgi:hypothetical protein